MKKLTAPSAAKQQTEYLKAVPSNIPDDQRSILNRPVWVPPAWAPVRPGADDHKQHKSYGVC